MTLSGVIAGAAVEGRRAPRRYWSMEEKRRLVAMTYEAGASVSIVARRYDVNANQLFTWRRALGRDGTVDLSADKPAALTFAPVDVVQEACGGHVASDERLIEIELPGGTKVRVSTTISKAVLVRVLAAVRAAS